MKTSDYTKNGMKMSGFQLLRGLEGIKMALLSLFFEHAKTDMKLMQGIETINRDIVKNINNHGLEFYFKKTV